MALTDISIRQAKPQEKTYHLPDGSSLFLEVTPSGGKLWRYRFRFNGKAAVLALGKYPDVGLAEARNKAGEARKQLSEGINPAAQRKSDKLAAKLSAANTFRAIAEEWHAKERHEWSEQHAERVMTSLELHIFPFIGSSPIKDIKPLELLEVLRRVEKAGNLDTCKRLRQRCSSIFRLAILTGRCDSDPAAPLVDALKTPQVEHRKALNRDELPEFLHALKEMDSNRQTKLMMELMLHTFTRVGEMSMARWEEIDFGSKLWTIPPEHRKLTEISKKSAAPHLVPLSDHALAILRELQAISGGREHIFPNRNSPNRPMSPETLRRALHRMGFKGKADVHGFRSTASTILNEEGFNPDAIERQLAHVERNRVRAAYNRAEYMEERRRMMQWWSSYIAQQQGDNVVPVNFQRAG
ncbi:tyrosine-type recombinase/integrase [Chromobacterium vaccinii]|uniref:tyrosine-type recombinase/integrase n=1 Tax=Chromobacterium TaxID=535 RepID=UPI001E51B1D4|nr:MULTISPECIES: tyrosine-type recombinase/integrase [Chromobacterium]MCD4487008.1 tyrosine-type recombinase/integrase [Chromobacterium vaccinii]MCD4503097.1 tyrosine-type recombinase/integrase [Chromobacterium piscinae]